MTFKVNDLRQHDMSQGDVILRCQDGSVPCHKVVLAALSPMLETILGEVTGEEPPTIIILPDIKIRDLTAFLTEFYKNSVSDVNTEMASLLGFKLRADISSDLMKDEAIFNESLKNPEELKSEVDSFNTLTLSLPVLTNINSDPLESGDNLEDERPSFEDLDPFIDIKDEPESHNKKSEEKKGRIAIKNKRKTLEKHHINGVDTTETNEEGARLREEEREGGREGRRKRGERVQAES